MSIAEILDTMEYGPAPESDTEARAWIAKHAEAGLFIDGGWRKPESGEWFETANPATGEVLARIAQAGAADVDAAVKAARKAQAGWARLSGHARATYLYAIARLIQRHSRLFAVIEALDNGKPIRETRDIDVPLVARHFYHHAGWAELMETELRDRAPVGRVRADHPVELPAADAGLEDRAGDRARQHVRAETGGVHAADGAALRRHLPDGRLAEGRRQHRHRRRGDGRADRQARRASTRSPSPARPRSAARSARRRPARASR